jgi:hypothetical protein
MKVFPVKERELIGKAGKMLSLKLEEMIERLVQVGHLLGSPLTQDENWQPSSLVSASCGPKESRSQSQVSGFKRSQNLMHGWTTIGVSEEPSRGHNQPIATHRTRPVVSLLV